MPPPTFHNFSTSHIIVIVLTFVVPLILAWIAWATRSERFINAVAGVFIVLLVANFFVHYVYLLKIGQWSMEHSLPMQLCDWALVVTVVALWTRNVFWFELSYFWGLGGTLQAIITPNLRCGFPAFPFISFFVTHSGIVAAVLFMVLTMSLRPRWPSLVRVFLWSEVYLACALIVNALTGGNYGFLGHKPSGTSMLDFFSNWRPLYILEMNLVAVGFFLILYLPFLLADMSGGRFGRRFLST